MRALIRLPNWLGDLVMSLGFMYALKDVFKAPVDVIVKKELAGLMPYFPHVDTVYSFEKHRHRSLYKSYMYGRQVSKSKSYSHFITLPNSFSSAWIGFATGIGTRIGFRQEGRRILLTHAYTMPKHIHRAEEYTYLLAKYFNTQWPQLNLSLAFRRLKAPFLDPAKQWIGLNFNSASPSKTLPASLALAYLDRLAAHYANYHFVLIGAPSQREYNTLICQARPMLKQRLYNAAGHTSLSELAQLLKEVHLLVSTDSGPAHLANSLHCPLVILLGAGDERNTGPYLAPHTVAVRAPGIACAPCVSVTCKWGRPKCLLAISSDVVQQACASLLAIS